MKLEFRIQQMIEQIERAYPGQIPKHYLAKILLTNFNEATGEARKEQWVEIRKWKPFLHFCPEWDGLLINKGEVEFDHCRCFEPYAVNWPDNEA